MNWDIFYSVRPEAPYYFFTINLTFAEWSSAFGDTKMTMVLPDSLNIAISRETGNESYRFRHS